MLRDSAAVPLFLCRLLSRLPDRLNNVRSAAAFLEIRVFAYLLGLFAHSGKKKEKLRSGIGAFDFKHTMFQGLFVNMPDWSKTALPPVKASEPV